MKKRANGELVNEDYLVCDSYQRGRGCDNRFHYNYHLWEGGILDAILLDAMGDRHFSSSETVRPLEIELAERMRRRVADAVRTETALGLFVETGRVEVKAVWMALIASIEGHDAAIADLQRRILTARGMVSPEEHRRRIFALRNTLEDENERVRFETRSRVMAAIHELVVSMSFSRDPLCIEISTKAGVIMEVTWEDWGGSAKGMTWAKWMPG